MFTAPGNKTLTAMNNLGNALQDEDRLADAEDLFRQSVELHRGTLGNEHPDTLRSINNLGTVLRLRGQLAGAESAFRELCEIRQRILGLEHPDTLSAMNNWGTVLLEQGKLLEAEEPLTKTLALRRKILGSKHADTLTSIVTLARLLQDQGKYADSAPLFEEAVEVASTVLPKGHIGIAWCGRMYGTCLVRLGRFDDAEAHLLQAHAQLHVMPRPQHRAIQQSLDALIALYEAWDKPEQAAKWRNTLAEWRASTQPVSQPLTQPSTMSLFPEPDADGQRSMKPGNP